MSTTQAKVTFTKLYDRKTPITAADLLNDRVVPLFEKHIAVTQSLICNGKLFAVLA